MTYHGTGGKLLGLGQATGIDQFGNVLNKFPCSCAEYHLVINNFR